MASVITYPTGHPVGIAAPVDQHQRLLVIHAGISTVLPFQPLAAISQPAAGLTEPSARRH
ncbi:hypothetical protein IWX87_003325 [Polaromonas sp. CG_9.7]|nr:hypothetical protein [Polaromonas sp. CG_9.7]MBG6115553.1 hypothetical protein [Polaromonas sp. CG_9.2]MDH6185866.1 hypothetical protein [Polaromonas sp. CG_23.6]